MIGQQDLSWVKVPHVVDKWVGSSFHVTFSVSCRDFKISVSCEDLRRTEVGTIHFPGVVDC